MATVQVSGVYPVGSQVSITGQVVAGDGHLVGGVLGASFGVPTITQKAPPTFALPLGLSSAQSFGAVTIRAAVAKPVGGVASAQAFGAVGIKIFQPVPVVGLGSAQQFGVPTVIAGQVVQVGGVPPGGVYVNTIVGQWLTGQAICGAQTYTQFGRPYVYLRQQSAAVPGVPSAQQFGQVTIKPGVAIVTVGGVPSAQQFGLPLVYRAWVAPLPPCTDIDLVALTCTDLVLAGLVATDINLTASACTDLTLTPSTCSTLDLDPVEAE